MNKQEFMRFLKNENAYHHWRYYTTRTINNSIDKKNVLIDKLEQSSIKSPETLTSLFFTWCNTLQGFRFWFEICRKTSIIDIFSKK